MKGTNLLEMSSAVSPFNVAFSHPRKGRVHLNLSVSSAVPKSLERASFMWTAKGHVLKLTGPGQASGAGPTLSDTEVNHTGRPEQQTWLTGSCHGR